jgi:tetratricopeptide (TPR) repeat protein
MSPAIDLVVGCGAWSLPLLILPYVLADNPQAGALAFSLLSVVVNGPHYMATIYRAYRTREDFARYRLRTLYCTLFLIAVLIAAHGFYGMVAWLMTIYLTWSPWHYMGQNFGLMLMFIHRNELKIDRRDRNVLWISFVASYLLTFLFFHTGPSTTPFWISLGFPPSILDTLRIPLMLVFFAGAIPLAKLIRQAAKRKRARSVSPSGRSLNGSAQPEDAKRKRDSAQPQQWTPMLAPLTLYVTQFLWAVLPSALVFLKGFGVPQVAYSVSMLAVMHCAQYVWITNYYARREAKAESTDWHWQRYFAILVIGGVALFIPGPWLASYVVGSDFAMSFMIFTAVINIHHFVLDGAIWKLRDNRIRSLLTAADNAVPAALVQASWIPAGRPWRLVGATVAVVLMILTGIDRVRYYLGNRNDIPSMALAATMNPHDSEMQMRLGHAYESAGDRTRMEDSFREAVRANPGNVEGQNAVAKVLLQTGRFDEGYAYFKQMFSRGNFDVESLANFGLLCKMLNRHDEAVTSFQRALDEDPNYAPVQLLLAEMLDADGKTSDAISHYEKYVALTPTVPSEADNPELQNAIARIHLLSGGQR